MSTAGKSTSKVAAGICEDSTRQGEELEASRRVLFERVASVIAETQELSPEAVALDSKFEELGIDSLNAFNLLCDLEEELGVVIPDDEAHQLSSVRELVDLVSTLERSGQQSPASPVG